MNSSFKKINHSKFPLYKLLAIGMIAMLIIQGIFLFEIAFWVKPFPLGGIMDLERDLIGVQAIEKGKSPYGKISELKKQFGAINPLESDPDSDTGWVVHPPLAIAFARLLFHLFGMERAKIIARQIGLVATLVLSLTFFLGFYRRRLFEAVLAAWCLIVWSPALTDLAWIQDNAIAGLLLFWALMFDAKERRMVARILMGILVAWKPWTAPFILMLPRGLSVIRDLLIAGGTAAAVTFGILPLVGGIASFWDWVLRAMPENLSVSQSIYVNISWTKWLSEGISFSIYLFALAGVFLARRRLHRNMWPAAAACASITFSPLVWDHYWVAISPAVAWMILTGPPLSTFEKKMLILFAVFSIAACPLTTLGIQIFGILLRPFLMAASAASLFALIIMTVASNQSLKKF